MHTAYILTDTSFTHHRKTKRSLVLKCITIQSLPLTFYIHSYPAHYNFGKFKYCSSSMRKQKGMNTALYNLIWFEFEAQLSWKYEETELCLRHRKQQRIMSMYNIKLEKLYYSKTK